MSADPAAGRGHAGELPVRESQVLAIQSVAGTALTVAHSLCARGLGRTIWFAALGIGLPVLGEYAGINIRPLQPPRPVWTCCSTATA